MIAQERADSADALRLIEELEAHLAALYRPQNRHGFSVAQLLEEGVAFFIIRDEGRPAGCVGLLCVGEEYAEIKRMYVGPSFRGRGLARAMLQHLVQCARERGITRLRLETGIHQREAIALYEQAGFYRIPAFGPYRDDGVSLCYEKRIGP